MGKRAEVLPVGEKRTNKCAIARLSRGRKNTGRACFGNGACPVMAEGFGKDGRYDFENQFAEKERRVELGRVCDVFDAGSWEACGNHAPFERVRGECGCRQ